MFLLSQTCFRIITYCLFFWSIWRGTYRLVRVFAPWSDNEGLSFPSCNIGTSFRLPFLYQLWYFLQYDIDEVEVHDFDFYINYHVIASNIRKGWVRRPTLRMHTIRSFVTSMQVAGHFSLKGEVAVPGLNSRCIQFTSSTGFKWEPVEPSWVCPNSVLNN